MDDDMLDYTLNYFAEREGKNLIAKDQLTNISISKDIFYQAITILSDSLGYLTRTSTSAPNLNPGLNIYRIAYHGILFHKDGGFAGQQKRKEVEDKRKSTIGIINRDKQNEEDQIRKLTLENLNYQKTNRQLEEDLTNSQIAFNNKKPNWQQRNWLLIAVFTFIIGFSKDVVIELWKHRKLPEKTKTETRIQEKIDSGLKYR